MRPIRFALTLIAAAAVTAAAPALAQQQQGRRGQAATAASGAEQSAVERLNEESLQRARQGQNSPNPGPDTTQNLNRTSEDAARHGRDMNRPPMPFR